MALPLMHLSDRHYRSTCRTQHCSRMFRWKEPGQKSVTCLITGRIKKKKKNKKEVLAVIKVSVIKIRFWVFVLEG